MTPQGRGTSRQDPIARLAQPFGTLPELIALHAARDPSHAAIVIDEARIDYASLHEAASRIAAQLQRQGWRRGDVVACCAPTSIEYLVLFIGALRGGFTVAPIAPNLPREAIDAMIRDSGAKRVYRGGALDDWMAQPRAVPQSFPASPADAFNIIYSSGTTGTPKGIVQPNAMRWAHMQRGPAYGYTRDSITLISTPLYSNTTLVSVFPTLATGGTVLLMRKFDAAGYLELAERHRATHTMLVPVQYQRILACGDFDRRDLASFRAKFSTSAPFPAALKKEVLDRWPGRLFEFYGMTEGGGTTILAAHEHPHKLHTVGIPAPGHDIRLIDDEGREKARGDAGEVVGHSGAMMTGYHRRADATRESEWFDPSGKRFIRTGDVGRFDEDGFLVLIDRKKDVIISGGFNVYPCDLEAVVAAHPGVDEVAVVAQPSAQWGETPFAFVTAKEGTGLDAGAVLRWANERLGSTQRLAGVRVVGSLPRNSVGKVLKRELRDTLQLPLRP